jgi:hypothetical protein
LDFDIQKGLKKKIEKENYLDEVGKVFKDGKTIRKETS